MSSRRSTAWTPANRSHTTAHRNLSVLCILILLLCAPPSCAEEASESPGIRGRVVDEKGKPIAGATVAAKVRGRQPMLFATTDADGRYRLGAARGRTLRLRGVAASAPGYPTRAVVLDRKEGSEGNTQHVMKDVVLSFTGVVRGHVVDAQGKGVPGARVDVFAFTPGGSSHGYGDVPARWPELGRWGRQDRYQEDAFTAIRSGHDADDQGRFEVTTVKAASYLVVASAPDRPPVRLDVPSSKMGKDKPVGELGRITVPEPSTMRVRLLSPGGKPLAECRVTLDWRHPEPNYYTRIWRSPTVKTDREGWVSLPFVAAATAYDLEVVGMGQFAAEAQVFASGSTLKLPRAR